MSRIGKLPIYFSNIVNINCINNVIFIKGPLGILNYKVNNLITFNVIKKKIVFKTLIKNRFTNIILGTTRSLINNMIYGVSIGFEKKLSLVGIGFRAKIKNKKLNLFIGFSHTIIYNIPINIICETPTLTEISIKGIDCQLVGKVASEIRLHRPPDPYKGKGIRYLNEIVILKESKKK